MFFFRAVSYLLMQRRICPYIACLGMAGSQLKKSRLMQAASHHETRSRISTYQNISPITVKVT